MKAKLARLAATALALACIVSAARAQPAGTEPAAAPTPPPRLLLGSVGHARIPGCEYTTLLQDLDAIEKKAVAAGAPGIAIAVFCGGQSIHASGEGQATLEAPLTNVHTNTVFRLASVTKPVTAALILKLAREGRLSLQDPLSRYLPDFPGGDRITLYQLLTHTSGLADFTEDASYAAHKTRPHSTAEMIAWIRDLNPSTRFAPGAGWAYSNSGYVLLGAVIEKVTGGSLDQAYDRAFNLTGWADTLRLDRPDAPLTRRPDTAAMQGPQMAAGYSRGPDRKPRPADLIDMSIPGAAGGLRGTAGEYAALMDSIFHGRFVGAEGLTQMTAPGLLADGRTNRWGMPREWREGLQADYGMGLFIDDKGGRRRWWHAGDIDGFHSLMVHYPKEDVTIVILRNGDYGPLLEDEIQAAVLNALGK